MLLQAGIHQLPGDIIFHILRRAACVNDNYHIDSWASSLELLAVCQQWRLLAERFVYSTITFSVSPALSEVYGSDGELAGYETIGYWKHNLSLIVSSGYARHVRRIVIERQNTPDQVQFIGDFLDALRLVTIDWSRITGLTCKFLGKRASSGDDPNENDTAAIAEYASTFARLIPNIHTFDATCTKYDKVASIFIEKLCAQYAPHMQVLHYRSLALGPAVSFGSQLTFLRVDCRNNLRLLEMSVYAPSLRYMELENLPYQYSWDTFRDDTNKHQLHFKSLTHLFVAYAYSKSHGELVMDSNMRTLRRDLLFPKLQHLEVTGILYNCPIVFSGLLPPNLQSLKLHCPARVANNLGNVELPKALFATCDIVSDRVNEFSNPMAAANVLLDAINSVHPQTVTYQSKGTSRWTDMTWRNIKNLSISGRMSPSDLLLVLSKLPDVQHMTIRSMAIELQEMTRFVEEKTNQPLDTKFQQLQIRTLHLYPNSGQAILNASIPLARLLLDTIPELRLVTINHVVVSRDSITESNCWPTAA